MKSELFFNDKKYIRCSENSIQAILIAQELARREESKFVELQHILGGLKQNKKSYAGKLLNKLNIAIHEKNFNSYYINSSIKKSSYDEIPLSESSRNIIQKALQESKNHLKYRFYLRSIFILKAILLNSPEYIYSSFRDIYKNKNVILNKIIEMEKIIPGLSDYKDLDFENMLQLEKEILGMIMLDYQVFYKVINVLRPEYFFYRKHEDIYRSALILHNQKKSVNLFEIRKYLLKIGMLEKIGGDCYLIEVAESATGISSVDEKVKKILKKIPKEK